MAAAEDNPGNKLLILDLDETLIYAATRPLDARAADFRVGPYHVYERPHLRPFLKRCLDRFAVAVWTSSSPAYAAGVVAALFEPSERARLAFVWASDRCTRAYDAECAEYYWRKNLSKVRRRLRWPLESIVVVDDTPGMWEQSYGNLVRVQPFAGEQADDELPRLLAYLDKVREMENIRAVEKRHWRQHSHPAG